MTWDIITYVWRSVWCTSEKRNTTRQEEPKQENTNQPTTKTNTQHQTQNRRQHRGETWRWNGPNALSTSPQANSPITTNKWYAVIHTKACLHRWQPQSEIPLSFAKTICVDGTAAGFQTQVSHHWQPMGPRPPRGRGRQLLVFHTPCIGDADEGPECSTVEWHTRGTINRK